MSVRVWLPLALLLNLSVSPADIERAVALAGASRTAERTAFHDRYLFLPQRPSPHPAGPAVAQIAVITDFRRAELAAEEREGLTRLFGPVSADAVAATLAPWRGLVAIDAYLQLPGCEGECEPPSDIDIAVGDDELPAVTVIRDDLHFKTGLTPPASPIVFEALFDAASIGQTTEVVRVTSGGHELARASVDFAALE